jgi:hypothetical protein
MKKIQRIIFLFILMVTFSCKEQELFIKCPGCTTEEPFKTNLEIKIHINYYGSATLIKVYEDNLEDSVLYSSHNASGTNTTIPVTINKNTLSQPVIIYRAIFA